jgi:serine/threonine-protein kinase
MSMRDDGSSGREERLNAVVAVCLEALELYPDLAPELAEFFVGRDQLDRLALPLRGLTPPDRPPADNVLELSTSPDRETLAPSKTASPRSFGDYELHDEIARGGMGIVFRARQLSLNRIVALKMIRTGELASPEDVERFRSEAQIVAQLRHPHIVPVHDFGEHERQLYFSMEWLDGGSLSEHIPELTENPTATARLLSAVARAVHHAHQHGILHRDLKPLNVLLDSEGRPYVADFGLSKRLTGAPALTASHAIVGTAPYMSPEQANGDKGLTTASDVYSLGAILFTLLTGRPPFEAETWMETLQQVREQEPPRPGSLRPGIDRDLETICLKCLQKEPRHRYTSAEALADDLERWLAGEPISARPVRQWERVWKWAKRRPAAAGLAATLLLVFVLGLPALAALWWNAEHHRGVADEKRAEADRNRTLAHKYLRDAWESLDTCFVRVTKDELLQAEGMEPVRKLLLEAPLKHYRDVLAQRPDDPFFQSEMAKAHLRIAQITEAIGNKAEALKAYKEARAVYEARVRAKPGDRRIRLDLSEIWARIGALQSELGQRQSAVRSLLHAQELRDQLVAEAPNNADFLAAQASLYSTRAFIPAGQLSTDESVRLYEKAAAIQEKLTRKGNGPSRGEYHLALAITWNNLAFFHHHLTGRHEEAVRLYRRAAARYRQILNVVAKPDRKAAARVVESGLGRTQRNLGDLLRALGRTEEALRPYEEAFALFERLSKKNPAVTEYRHQLATTCVSIGDLHRRDRNREQAVAWYRWAQALHRKTAEDNPQVTRFQTALAESYVTTGELHHKEGRRDEALRWYEQARKRLEGLHPSLEKDRGRLRSLARVHAALGDLARDCERAKRADALHHHQQARALWKKLLAQEAHNSLFQLNYAAACNTMGGLLCDAGRLDEAGAVYQEALAIREKVSAKYPGNVWVRRALGRSYFGAGYLARQRGEPDRALHWYGKAYALQKALVRPGAKADESYDELACTCHGLGQVHQGAGRLEDALRFFLEEHRLAKQLADSDPKVPKWQDRLAGAACSVGEIHAAAGRRVEARAWYEKARPLWETLAAGERKDPQPHLDLARIHHLLGELVAADPEGGGEALRHHEKSLEVLEKLVTRHPDDPVVLNNLGSASSRMGELLVQLGEPVRAVAAHEKSLRWWTRLAAGEPNNLRYQRAVVLSNRLLGQAHRQAAQPAEARRCYKAAWDWQQKVVERIPRDTTARHELAEIYYWLGNLCPKVEDRAATAHYQQARTLLEQLVREDPDSLANHHLLGGTLNNLALALERRGLREEGIGLLQKAIEHQLKAFGKAPEVPAYRTFLDNHYKSLGAMQCELGRHAEASATVRSRIQLWPKDPVKLATAAGGLAGCIGLVGKGKEQLSDGEQAERTRYADEAMVILGQAVRAGFADVDHLEQGKELEPLRQRGDFQELLRQVRMLRKPGSR